MFKTRVLDFEPPIGVYGINVRRTKEVLILICPILTWWRDANTLNKGFPAFTSPVNANVFIRQAYIGEINLDSAETISVTSIIAVNYDFHDFRLHRQVARRYESLRQFSLIPIMDDSDKHVNCAFDGLIAPKWLMAELRHKKYRLNHRAKLFLEKKQATPTAPHPTRVQHGAACS